MSQYTSPIFGALVEELMIFGLSILTHIKLPINKSKVFHKD